MTINKEILKVLADYGDTIYYLVKWLFLFMVISVASVGFILFGLDFNSDETFKEATCPSVEKQKITQETGIKFSNGSFNITFSEIENDPELSKAVVLGYLMNINTDKTNITVTIDSLNLTKSYTMDNFPIKNDCVDHEERFCFVKYE